MPWRLMGFIEAIEDQMRVKASPIEDQSVNKKSKNSRYKKGLRNPNGQKSTSIH